MKINTTFSKALFFILALFCLVPVISSPIALLLGFVFSLLIGNPFAKWSNKGLNILLKISVIGLGFGMHIDETLKTSQDAFFLTLSTICICLALGALLGKAFKLDYKIAYLISVGTAICGGSAIAAVSPIIKAEEKQISIALVVVMFLNAIALLIFPNIAHYFQLSQEEFGFWAAVAIHDTSSVVGAALHYGDEALRIATTVKLSRALWIVPVAIFSLFLFAKKTKSFKFPWFILGFITVVLGNSYLAIPIEISEGISFVVKRLLVLCMFLIGIGLSIKAVKESGIKPVLLGLILWCLISILSFVFITIL